MENLLAIFLAQPDTWLSGEQLADKLGISRTAVWKQIQQLKKQGYHIVSHQGLGYQYQGTQTLNPQIIQQNLPADLPVQLEVHASLTSTNDYAKQHFTQAHYPQPVVILADTQTHGRGRLGRTFYAPKTTGLYLSIVLPLKPKTQVLPSLLTTGTGTAVVQALRDFFPALPVQLKWINDIVLHGKKCGGILTEAITDLESGQISHLIVGIGLNLNTTVFPEEIQAIAGALSQQPVDRNRLVAMILTNFFNMYADYKTGAFLEKYRQYSSILGHTVALVTNTDTIQGTAIDFDYQGFLVLRQADGQIKTMRSGEIVKVNPID